MQISPIQEVGPGTLRIDLDFQGQPGVIAAYLLERKGELALVETGPSTTIETLLARIREAGADPADITRVLVTHIHLDHSGGTGLLLDFLPRADVFVHPRGAPHLIDPTRLLRSAGRIYGDAMDTLWGEVRPVDPDRIRTVGDGEMVHAGGRGLHAVDTPGHATHHYAWHDVEGGMVFTGDVAGIRLPGSSHVRPPTPPPEIDLEAWAWSVLRLRALGAPRFCLTHFGAVDDVPAHLDNLLCNLHRWAGRVEAWVEVGMERDEIVERMTRFAREEITDSNASDEVIDRYEEAIDTGMGVDGLLRALARPVAA